VSVLNSATQLNQCNKPPWDLYCQIINAYQYFKNGA